MICANDAGSSIVILENTADVTKSTITAFRSGWPCEVLANAKALITPPEVLDGNPQDYSYLSQSLVDNYTFT
jgi:hypothetical protein